MSIVQRIMVILGIGFLGIGSFLLYRASSPDKAKYRIGIFLPVIHPALDEIVRGFKETIAKNSTESFSYKEYNADGSSTLLRAQADEMVQQDFDLIFTVGAHSSQAVHEIAQKKQSSTPQVFAAVDDPVLIGLVDSLVAPGHNVTGVVHAPTYDEQIAIATNLKPSAKRFLLVYNPAHGSGLEKHRKEIEAILSKQGMTLQAVEVAHQNEIAQRVTGFLSDTDVVLVLTDNTVVAGLDSLVALCNRYGVLLYASDLNSGDKGAALSYGVYEYDYGMLGAELALMILEQKKDPATVAVKNLVKRKIKINKRFMDKQGLSLADEQLKHIEQEGGVVV